MKSWLMLLLSVSCGLIVANLYYAQPLVGPISADTGLPASAAGLIVTLTQIGYAGGLLFIVPLSDKLENRRLISIVLLAAVAALLAAAWAPRAVYVLAAALLLGTGSVAAQILVPYATHLASEEQRGRVVGNVMSGLLLGIMFARPVASFVADSWGWRSVFTTSAVILTLLTLLLSRALPPRRPKPLVPYRKLLGSLLPLLRHTPALRRRAIYQACLFGAFSLFWTVVPLRLTDEFGLSQSGVAWFALAGVGGAAAAPIAGRLADKGWSRILTGAAMGTAVLSLAVSLLIRGHSTAELLLLAASAITLDMAVSGNLVLGQRVIFSLGSETRGRLNGLFMSIFFLGGAAGSSLGGWAYAAGGWTAAMGVGAVLPLIALLYYFTEHTKPLEQPA
ncbi:MFS transporter [Gorillibacterium sp. sgz5001074]|uniref:MFS transporter n=1 Tax=Gorillibacterium sp. sgz5001074 TaxID=3446695 RepID=UPI003F66119A